MVLTEHLYLEVTDIKFDTIERRLAGLLRLCHKRLAVCWLAETCNILLLLSSRSSFLLASQAGMLPTMIVSKPKHLTKSTLAFSNKPTGWLKHWLLSLSLSWDYDKLDVTVLGFYVCSLLV